MISQWKHSILNRRDRKLTELITTYVTDDKVKLIISSEYLFRSDKERKGQNKF